MVHAKSIICAPVSFPPATFNAPANLIAVTGLLTPSSAVDPVAPVAPLTRQTVAAGQQPPQAWNTAERREGSFLDGFRVGPLFRAEKDAAVPRKQAAAGERQVPLWCHFKAKCEGLDFPRNLWLTKA